MNDMAHEIDPELAALVGSRICHDLVSPLGAIGNGIELMAMTGGAGAEMDLVSESVENANARIRFFRLAFGSAADGQTLPAREVGAIAGDTRRGSRLELAWRIEGDLSRREGKLLLLVLSCIETAASTGGKAEATRTARGLRISARSPRLRFDGSLWAALGDADHPILPPAAQVHFALAPRIAAEMGRPLSVERTDERIDVTF
jgi:histidine phosphotransferase ChpT